MTQIHGWTCKDQAVCDNPHSQDYSEIDNDLMAHTDPSYTDPQCLLFPCGGSSSSAASRPNRILLAEHETLGIPLNPPPFGSVMPEAVLKVYELPNLSLDPQNRKLLYTIVHWEDGSRLIPAE